MTNKEFLDELVKRVCAFGNLGDFPALCDFVNEEFHNAGLETPPLVANDETASDEEA